MSGKKMCKGCRSAVSNPLSCPSCNVISHPGCLGRTGHQWKTGMLLDCKEGIGALSPSLGPLSTGASQEVGMGPTNPPANDALLSSLQRLMSNELDKFRAQLRSEYREELTNCRSEMLREFKEECKRLGSSIGVLSSRVDAMETRLDDLGALARTGDVDVIEAAVAEVNDRKSRENNLMVFKLKEVDISGVTAPGAATVNVDRVKVASILNEIAPNCYDNITVRRIGKKSPGNDRPIKVSLPSDIAALSIIRRKNIYKGAERIAMDYTEQQRNHLRGLQERLRLSEDPTLTIKFKNGTPMIARKGSGSVPKNHE